MPRRPAPTASTAPPPATDTGPPTTPYEAELADARRQLDALPGIYNPQRANARAQAQAALEGYGDVFSWQADNPATPQDESLVPVANPGSKTGSLYRDANRNTSNAFAAQGALYSSYAERARTVQFNNLDTNARRIVTQYAGQLADIGQQQNTEWNSIRSNAISLFGPDAQWIAETAINIP